jgi:hypothetical protein
VRFILIKDFNMKKCVPEWYWKISAVNKN